MIRNWIDLLHVPEYYRIAERIGHGTTWDKRLLGADLITELGLDLQVPLLRPLVVNTFGNLSSYPVLMNMKIWDKLESLDIRPEGQTLELMPSFVHARGVRHKTSLVCADYDGKSDRFTEEFRFGSLLFAWGQRTRLPAGSSILKHDFPGKDAGFPTIVEMKDVRLLLTDGMLSAAGKPAFKASTLSVAWGDMSGDGNAGVRRAGGPTLTWIREYKEFWFAGEMRGSRWTDISHQWSLTVSGAYLHQVAVFLKEKCKGTPDPFSNRFFTNDSDEFNFMSEFQLPN